MATHGSELTALYMETTNIANSWKVVKGSTERSEDLMSSCNESIMKMNKENKNLFKLQKTTRKEFRMHARKSKLKHSALDD